MKRTSWHWLLLIAFINVFCSAAYSASDHRSHFRFHPKHVEHHPNNLMQTKPLGLGIMLGDLNGITGKYWVSAQNAYDGGFTYRIDDYAALNADYLWNVARLFGLSGRQRPHDSLTSPYFGIGAITYFDTSKGILDPNQDTLFQKLGSSGMALGARIPIGIEYQPATVPCGIFGELAPGAVLIPGMISVLQAEAGVRFYI